MPTASSHSRIAAIQSLILVTCACYTTRLQFKQPVAMSYPDAITKRPNLPAKIVDVINHTNIDDFFHQPSAHELTIASERRVQKMMTDLRQNIEEMESWSRDSNSDETSEPGKLKDSEYRVTETGDSAKTDTVSSLVSLLPTSSSLHASADANYPAALTYDSKISSRPKPPQPIRCQAATAPLQSELLRTSGRQSKPNRNLTKEYSFTGRRKVSSSLSATRHGAKVPPAITVNGRDYKYQYPRTPFEDPRTPPLPFLTVPAVPKAILKQNTGVKEPVRTRHAPKADLPPASHKETAPTPVKAISAQSTAKNAKNACNKNIEPSLIARRNLTPPSIIATGPEQEKLLRDFSKVNRKPLPLDSPLLIPMKRHPALANGTSARMGRNEVRK